MRKSILILNATVASVLFFTACNDTIKPAALFDLAAAKASIVERENGFMEAMAKKDSVGLANCYTTDAKWMMGNMSPVSGKSAIQSFFSGVIKGSPIDQIKVTTADVWGNENMLAEEGMYSFLDKSGKEVDHGKFIALYRKENGTWKMFRDCPNSDMPCPTMAK